MVIKAGLVAEGPSRRCAGPVQKYSFLLSKGKGSTGLQLEIFGLGWTDCTRARPFNLFIN